MTPRYSVIVLSVGLSLCVQAQPLYPVIEQAAQGTRDEDRRLILETELHAERDALSKAQSAPAISVTLERQAEVHRHTENIKALQRELAGMTARQPSTGEPQHVIVKAISQATISRGRGTTGAARFWNPYNRAPDPVDSSTTSRRDVP
jgi:hypothetical protein